MKQERRSNQQSKAFHLLCQMIADDLNEHGIYQRVMLEAMKAYDVPNTKDSIKNMIKSIVEAQTLKTSTSTYTGKDIDLGYDSFNKLIAEETGLHTAFPSVETLMLDQDLTN